MQDARELIERTRLMGSRVEAFVKRMEGEGQGEEAGVKNYEAEEVAEEQQYCQYKRDIMLILKQMKDLFGDPSPSPNSNSNSNSTPNSIEGTLTISASG
jgi:hypothetical protein